MTDIRFYHLQTRSIDQALPDIVQKALSAGHRILIRTTTEDEAERLNQHLWAWRAESFIPHGSKKDGNANRQPVWLTAGNDNPNEAKVLILTAGQDAPDAADFTLCCDMFDGRDETQVAAARKRWKIYKEAGHTMTYWQQTEKGWEKKT